MLSALIVSGPFVDVLFVFADSLQGMGKAWPATIVGLSRYGLVFIPLVYALNTWFSLNGVSSLKQRQTLYPVLLHY